MKEPTVDDLSRHVQNLARAGGLDLEVDPGLLPHQAVAGLLGSPMGYQRRVVRCHPVIDETTYAVALHEMGHLLGPGGMTGNDVKLEARSVVCYAELEEGEETAAWDWAHQNALLWTPVMDIVETYAMTGYRNGIKSAGRVDDAIAREFGPRAHIATRDFITSLMMKKCRTHGYPTS